MWKPFAQRSGRQQAAIARAAVVEHQHLELTRQGMVLQAVVGDQQVDLRMGLAQGPGGGQAVAPDRNGRRIAFSRSTVTCV